MEGKTTFKPQGSFGIPEHLVKQMEEQRRVKVAPPKEEPEQHPKAPEQAPAQIKLQEAPSEIAPADKKEQEDQDAIRKAKKFWEDQLETTITTKDMQDYIFKGRMVKDGIFIAAIPDDKNPGKYHDFKVTFQSHTPSDLAEIDEKMADYRSKAKFTPEGLDNEKSLLTLSYVLLSADGRSFGKNPEERYKNIKGLAGGVVSLIVEAWDGLNLLIRYSLREKKLFKK